ncbi:right-handed parallel beta-helix repeat-containing protein [Kitasatospora sp. NBC_01287]|uniref:right-handed parallel beta-helix repeat-containing protein n=1 Tax=Kitasatospora sp. NBC_01287 TaxID=2903573 RepID=UPI00225686AA|nr:right-handed parallel beta-helix repeat-containing protein [Kitasatospora sp. NBC_01287]MCX4744166.1 right-handed parallel beta-helix repeat-containing protein [Kitasatospora sp. NBC_01287]
MPVRRARRLVGATAGLLLALAAAAPAHAATFPAVHVVHPGESIQRAVDAARPGDTVLVLPGRYQGSVQIGTQGLKLRGTGPQTVLTPGPAGSANACAQAGHGLCVTGTAGQRLTDVRIESLAVSGFPKNGISASETDRLTVRGVLAEENGEEGISQEKSIRGRFEDNDSRRNGEAGIFLANIAYGEGGAIDTQGAVISGNRLTGNRMGVVVRRLRDLTVERNTITGNCGGVFVVGDENRPRAGALTVRHNRVDRNNKYCPTNDRLPFIQGSGIVLTGVEDTVVTRNEVDGNVGASPLSGGIVLFRSYVGGPSTGNSIADNHAADNGPADLADRDGGAGNTFTGNTCRTSEPAGRC